MEEEMRSSVVELRIDAKVRIVTTDSNRELKGRPKGEYYVSFYMRAD